MTDNEINSLGSLMKQLSLKYSVMTVDSERSSKQVEECFDSQKKTEKGTRTHHIPRATVSKVGLGRIKKETLTNSLSHKS